ncbi:hypothetical protein CPC08DRAFT_768041 [Agrocybe pediades]|nr:hypothetical protein CPC08DRAFT_768041 [Agrocybe pediades]
MVAHRWTSPTQKAWLQDQVQDFIKGKAKGEKAETLKNIYVEWWKVFPQRLKTFPAIPLEVQLTPEQTAIVEKEKETRKKQIASWLDRAELREKELAKGKKGANLELDIIEAVVGSASANTKDEASRLPQEVEAFQTLYAAEINAEVGLEWKSRNVTSKSERLSVRREVVQRLWKDATEEARVEVRQHIKRAKDKKEARKQEKMHERAAGNETQRTPEEYQVSLKQLRVVATKLLAEPAERTGWTFFLAAGGPVPSQQGEIALENYYVGETDASDRDMAAAYPKAEGDFMRCFSEHIEACYALPRSHEDATVGISAATIIRRKDHHGGSASPPVNEEAYAPGFEDDGDGDGGINMHGSPHPEQEQPTSSAPEAPRSIETEQSCVPIGRSHYPTPSISWPSSPVPFSSPAPLSREAQPLSQTVNQSSLPMAKMSVSWEQRTSSNAYPTAPGGPSEPIENAFIRMGMGMGPVNGLQPMPIGVASCEEPTHPHPSEDDSGTLEEHADTNFEGQDYTLAPPTPRINTLTGPRLESTIPHQLESNSSQESQETPGASKGPVLVADPSAPPKPKVKASQRWYVEKPKGEDKAQEKPGEDKAQEKPAQRRRNKKAN